MPRVVLGILLLLAGMIGVERVLRPAPDEREVSGKSVPSRDRDTPPRAGGEIDTPDSAAPAPPAFATDNALNPPAGLEPARAESFTPTSGDAWVNPSGGIQVPLYFIHSRRILFEGDEVDRELLLAAVRDAAEALDGPVHIVDADALGTSQSPFLVYARPRFDLTERVHQRFKALLAERLVEREVPFAEQAAAPGIAADAGPARTGAGD